MTQLTIKGEMKKTNFSKNLKLLRSTSKFTQHELGKKLKLNRAVIGSYEEGRAEPSFKTLIKISALFNVTIDDLIKIKIK